MTACKSGLLKHAGMSVMRTALPYLFLGQAQSTYFMGRLAGGQVDTSVLSTMYGSSSSRYGQYSIPR